MAVDPQLFRKIRRVAGVVCLVAALLFVAGGAWQLRAWSWPTATGNLTSCTVHTTRTATSSSTPTTRTTQTCRVTWVADGTTHTDTVEFGDRLNLGGTSRKMSVQGDTAYPYGSRYDGLAIIGFGALFALVGVILLRWRPRSERWTAIDL